MATIHIGQHIQNVFKKKGMTVSEFGRRINKSRENVYDIFRRKSIDTALLQKISEVLEFDFFRFYRRAEKETGMSVAGEPTVTYNSPKEYKRMVMEQGSEIIRLQKQIIQLIGMEGKRL